MNWLDQLIDVLADLYPTRNEARRIVACARMKTELIEFEDRAKQNWFNILVVAQRAHGRKPGHPAQALALLDCALKDYEGHEDLLALKDDEPPVDEATTEESHLEMVMGSPRPVLSIPFFERALERARSVAFVERREQGSVQWVATGFLIRNGWLLTNHHVLPSAETARGTVVRMNYRELANGLIDSGEPYVLDPSRFHTSEANDWTVVGIDETVNEKWGAIELTAVEIEVNACVHVIGHPAGLPQRVSLDHPIVSIGEGRVQYITDAYLSSSGAPVFDDQWRVVALHHSAGMLREPGTKTSFYRNEGIAIKTVIDDLRAAGVN